MTRPLFKYPVELVGAQNIRMTYDGVTETLELGVAQHDIMYWCTGEGTRSDDWIDIIWAFETVAEATFSCALDVSVDPTTQKLVLQGDEDFQIHWTSDLTTLPAWVFGFDGDEDTASGTSLTSTFAVGGTWLPSSNPFPDTYDTPRVVSQTTRCLHSGKQRTIVFHTGTSVRRMGFQYEPRGNVIAMHSQTSPSGTFETFHRKALSKGKPIRYYADRDDVASTTEFSVYKHTELDNVGWEPWSDGQAAFYMVELDLIGSTAGED